MMADYDFLLADDWDEFSAASCDCPTAPRQFLIPPPPPPPAMGVCGGAPLADPHFSGGQGGGYFCHLEPMGAEFTQAGFPSLPVIAVCSSVVLVAILVASFLLWRHKTKVQNILPCKQDLSQTGGHCGVTGTNGLTYEEALINHHPTRLPMGPGAPQMISGHTFMPIELLDVKLGDVVSPDTTILHPGSFYPCHDGARLSKPFQHPVYEEIAKEHQHPTKSINSKSYDSDMEGSARNGGRSFTSEDEFAEDELSGLEYPSGDCSSRHCSATSSVQGSTGGDLCRDPVSSDEGTGDDGEYHARSAPPNRHSFDYPGRKQVNLARLIDGGDELNPVPKTFHHHHGALPKDNATKQFLLPPARGATMPPAQNLWCQEPMVENIYSTIDDSVLDDGSSAPSRNVHHGHHQKRNTTKNHGGKHQLSQRNDEDTESYGDIMPAYDSASCAT